ncbi:hypothetical protein GCM10022422_25060 [Flavobacterium ginsengisoli]|uniref:Uncharacterized protein n=1 Tax=Flavobacterium ginsengisoli TaxID=871694 RepID=A0ABP7FJ42_9FLAO
MFNSLKAFKIGVEIPNVENGLDMFFNLFKVSGFKLHQKLNKLKGEITFTLKCYFSFYKL